MRLIVKDPDGFYAEFSTIVDAFLVTGMSQEGIRRKRERDAINQANKTLDLIFEDLDNDKLAITWEDAVALHNEDLPEEDQL